MTNFNIVITARRRWVSLLLCFFLAGCLTNPHQPPLLLRGDTLAFPAAARAAGIEGVVRVRYDVDVEGRVRSAVIVSAEPSGVFEAAALQAVRSWRFRPGRRAGELVVTQGLVSTLRFAYGESDDYPRRD